MPTWNPRANEIIMQALEVSNPDARAQLIDNQCAGDAALRAEVESLLAAHDQAGRFLLSPTHTGHWREDEDAPAGILDAGNVLAGRYVLRRRLGAGGMGVVWLAEQQSPVQREVAIKVIREGLDVERVATRFEQERKALALMQHPNIAQILDAGVIDLVTGEELSAEALVSDTVRRRGMPFFAMEYIPGIPITEYCDRKRLSPHSRLQLFLPVCEAVQHAHQKGIIHRDLKPSNILVEVIDDGAVAKVIDFGVAKATGIKLTDESLHTDIGSIVGTLEYMSPEQARFSDDIDTRTDVYALGAVLYELLVGSVPHGRHELNRAGLDEILRVIKEDDPVAPSSKLSHSEALPNIASERDMVPSRLIRVVRGDLDWIVLKALDKDRARRYKSVSGLAADVERFLSDEPVLARPPSTWYRLQKAYRRHRAAFCAAGIALVLLVLGTIGTTTGFFAATRNAQRAERQATRASAAERQTRDSLEEVKRQRDEAEAQRRIATAVKQFLRSDLLQQADIVTQADALRRQSGVAAIGAAISQNPTIRELVDRAAVQLEEEHIEENFPGQPIVQAELLVTVGFVYRSLGEYEKAMKLFRRARAIYTTYLQPTHPSAINCTAHLAEACKRAGRLDEMLALAQDELKQCRLAFGPADEPTLMAMRRISDAYSRLGETDQGIAIAEEAANLAAQNPDLDFKTKSRLQFILASSYMRAGRLDDALRVMQLLHDARVAELGTEHPDTIMTATWLGSIHLRRHDLARAIPQFERTVKYMDRVKGPDHPETTVVRQNLAYSYKKVGRHEDATRIYEVILAQQQSRDGENARNALATMAILGECYQLTGQNAQAIETLRETLDRGAMVEEAQLAIRPLARVMAHEGRVEEAEQVCRRQLVHVRRNFTTRNRTLRAALFALGTNLMGQAKWADAESFLRELVELGQKHAADRWTTFRSTSLLGESLMEQRKYEEAEPLLLSGFEGIQQRQDQLEASERSILPRAAERLVRLYEATGDENKLGVWKNTLKGLETANER